MEGDGLVRGCSASDGSRGPVRHGLSSVDGDRVSLELDPLVCGGSSWLNSISSSQQPRIIERACAGRGKPLYLYRNKVNNSPKYMGDMYYRCIILAHTNIYFTLHQ